MQQLCTQVTISKTRMLTLSIQGLILRIYDPYPGFLNVWFCLINTLPFKVIAYTKINF